MRFRIFVFGVLILILTGCEPDRAQIAYDLAQDSIKLYLKSPASAKFPDKKEITIYQDGSTWQISGYYDAQNVMGVAIRGRYKAKVKDITMDGKYDLFDYLELDGNQVFPLK